MSNDKFETGHEIFDHISNFRDGSSMIIFDETHFGALCFAISLFKDITRPVVVISNDSVDTTFNIHRLDLSKLTDMTSLSVEIERVRRLMKNKGLLIHSYLPQILVREDEDRVLKLVQHWQEWIQNTDMLEVYLLASEAFPDFGKKIEAMTSGSLEIKRVNNHFAFRLLSACKPEYLMMDFPFMIKDEELLIKWGDEFTQILPKETILEVNKRIKYLNENISTLRVKRLSREPTGLTVLDKWFFSQLSDMKLSEIAVLFPEKLDEIFEKLAIWSLRGYLTLQKEGSSPPPSTSEELNFKTKMALAIPTNLALLLLTESPKSIPMDVYSALRRSVTAFTREQPNSMVELNRYLTELEKQFQDMTARVTAINKMLRNKENPHIKFNLKYLPKMLSITFYYGYRLKVKIEKINDLEYILMVPECFLCKGVKSASPVCHILEGTVTGTLGVLFKEKFECYEKECKAMGSNTCEFHIKRIE